MTEYANVTDALKALTVARPDYDEAQRFYDGQVPEVFASRKLRDLLKDQGRHFKINFARTPVDIMVERTAVQSITATDASVQTLLDLNWDDNELGIEAKDVHRRAYEYGDAYLIASPDEEVESGVSCYAHDPQCVRVFYDPERPRKKSHAVHKWHEAAGAENGLPPGTWLRIAIYYPDVIEQWVSRDVAVDVNGRVNRLTDDSEMLPYTASEGEAWPTLNPVPGVIPVFHFRTARPYGRPEHADAYGPQQGINKLYLSMISAVDHQVLPKRYILTDSALDSPSNAADPFAAATGEIDTEAQTGLDANSDLSDDPGDVWLLSGSKVSVGQFNAADLDNFTGPIDALVQHMADVTDMPADRYHRGGQASSGESKRLDEMPLQMKAADRMAQFGVTWHEYFSYVCAVNGISVTDAAVNWAPPVAYNDKASWETAALQLAAGVPFDQVLRERGYLTEQIEEWEAAKPEPVAPVVVAPVVEGDSTS